MTERLFGHHYAQELRLPAGDRSTKWVARLPTVVSVLSNEVTHITGKKPKDAIKAKPVARKPASVVPGRPVDLKNQKLHSGVGLLYLYQLDELKDGHRRGMVPLVILAWRPGHKPSQPVLYTIRWMAHREALSARSFLLPAATDWVLRC